MRELGRGESLLQMLSRAEGGVQIVYCGYGSLLDLPVTREINREAEAAEKC